MSKTSNLNVKTIIVHGKCNNSIVIITNHGIGSIKLYKSKMFYIYRTSFRWNNLCIHYSPVQNSQKRLFRENFELKLSIFSYQYTFLVQK
jgi:hypothetical protein